METLAAHSGLGGWLSPAAYVAIGSIAVSCVALAALHIASPEFAPSWRMVSEYANGHYKWLLSIVFFAWAAGSFALLVGLWPLSGSWLGKLGLGFLVLAGIGQIMGGLFDINHKLHGPAAMIGIPSLCIAVVLLNMALTRYQPAIAPLWWTAHVPWISFVLMAIALALFFSALKSAGVDVSSQTGPLKALPAGVNGYVGWANRLIFLSTYLWVVLASLSILRAKA